MTENMRNLHAALATPEDSGVPAEVDLVFMCDVLHQIQNRPTWLARLAHQMHKGARLAKSRIPYQTFLVFRKAQ